jgi:hypothetical protein
MAPSALFNGYRRSSPMSQPCHFDASRSLAALEQDSTIIAVIEMSQSKLLVAALVPGVERQPLKKLDAQEEGLLKLLHRWRIEAGQAVSILPFGLIDVQPSEEIAGLDELGEFRKAQPIDSGRLI